MNDPGAPSIVTVTVNPCIDASSGVDRVVPDRKLRCGPPRYEPGGGGINVARAVRRLGGEALAIYPSGGPAGLLLEALLNGEDVANRPVPIAGWTRENLNVLEESTGRQFRFVLPGPILSLVDASVLYAVVASLSPFPEYLVASGSLPPGVSPDFYSRLALLARARRSRFVLDTSGEAARLALQEGGVYLMKPSVREFRELTGVADGDEGRLVAEARRLIAMNRCEVLVLSLGPAGVLCVTATSVEHIASPSVPVRSAVGAGDALLAGIVLRLQRGRPLGEAVRFGVAAGAAAVMNPGTELCRREDAERLEEAMRVVGGTELKPLPARRDAAAPERPDHAAAEVAAAG
jgi:6-phosphofructokinase 2